MKKNSVIQSIVLIVIILSAIGCMKSDKVSEATNIDSLTNIINEQRKQIDSLKQKHPFVEISRIYAGVDSLVLYKPEGLEVEITHIRPAFNNATYLCVPAAYTTRATTIDGVFIESGKMINETQNNALTGICILKDADIEILKYDSDLKIHIDNSIKNKESLFQQTLLIADNEIYTCSLFGSTKNKRRALIHYNKSTYICESQKALTIHEFQRCLKFIDVENAVNLDMGTWSEGWYKNDNNEIIKTGESTLSTQKQTNWIVFKKQF